MLAKSDRMVKEVPGPMFSILGRLLRGVLRLAFVAGAVAGAVALARRIMGSLAGDPGTPHSPGSPGAGSANGGAPRPHTGVPMSFDSWPPVPPAPHRSKN
jgi:hypothetical protein